VYHSFFAPACDGSQIIAATAAYFANGYLLFFAKQLFKAFYGYDMTAQPGVYKVKFLHIPLNILKRNTVAIKQFFFI
jgi:hypothetical protein